MSHKSKKRKVKLYPPALPPQVAVRRGKIKKAKRGSMPDFSEMQRQTERHLARHEQLQYRIAPDCKVHIQFNGIATRDAIRKLINYLEIGIDDFPESADDPPALN
jgi:hypothetical protein